MAKSTKQKIVWMFKSVRNWFLIKYKRFRGEQPYIFHIYDNRYTFESKKKLDKMLEDDIKNHGDYVQKVPYYHNTPIRHVRKNVEQL